MTLREDLSRFPRAPMGHFPTPLEPMPRLGAELGLDLWVKRDDCTGIGFGGNKVRQLEFYLGQAQAAQATQVLITGAVQSNFVRVTAAMASRLGMGCHIQLEERVPDRPEHYYKNGNVLLDHLFGATLYSYPDGEDEAGADARIRDIARGLEDQGERCFAVPLAADHPPIGALGYIEAAEEVLAQGESFDEIFIGSGSALTHCGLLFGLRALRDDTPVTGVCVRRPAVAQEARVTKRTQDLAELMQRPNPVPAADVRLEDGALGPGYGQLDAASRDAIHKAARVEGLLLDPVYTAKTMAAIIQNAPRLQGKRVLFWHTGGQPALFGYSDALGLPPASSD